MKKPHLAVLLNLIYWLPIIFRAGLYVYGSISYLSNPAIKENLLLEINTSVVDLVVFYSFYFLIFPGFFSKPKIALFAIYGIGIILIISGMGYAVNLTITRDYHMQMGWYYLVTISFTCVVSAFTASLIRACLNWYSDSFYKKQLEKRNLEAELALLKAQINPHFLFNTLNNIDILIENDAKTASNYLKKLSDILRFMLYQGPMEKIALTQEVTYIQKYIDLQKIRTANTDFVKFEVSGDLDGLQIAPMLFIPFIENAFKHCTNKKINNAIEIMLSVHHNEVDFTCSNAFDQQALPAQERIGLGLELIRNRLNLLYKNHQLNIEQKNNRFIVALKVKLDDN